MKAMRYVDLESPPNRLAAEMIGDSAGAEALHGRAMRKGTVSGGWFSFARASFGLARVADNRVIEWIKTGSLGGFSFRPVDPAYAYKVWTRVDSRDGRGPQWLSARVQADEDGEFVIEIWPYPDQPNRLLMITHPGSV